MKRNLFLSMSAGACILAATTGCLEQKVADDPSLQASNREALVTAMDNQAVSLIDSLNSVVIGGAFIQNLALENPPKPIPIDSENDVKKVVDYFLANESVSGTSSVYHPDPRLCSEVIAKEHPQACQQLMSKVSIYQEASDKESGYVQIQVDGAAPFGFAYTPSLVSLRVQLDQLLIVAQKINTIKMALGEQIDELPSSAQGTAILTVSNQMGASIIDLTVTQALQIAGTNSQGQAYSINVLAANNIVTASLFTALGLGSVSLNIPAASVLFPIHDDQNNEHVLGINFPGLSGQINLNNAASIVEFVAMNLGAPSVDATIDGQQAAHITVGQLDAQVKASNGDLTATLTNGFSAALVLSPNAMTAQSGTVTGTIAPNTELLFAYQSKQVKINQGSFSLIGTGDFTANMDAQAGMCAEGTQNQPIFLETVVCQ